MEHRMFEALGRRDPWKNAVGLVSTFRAQPRRIISENQVQLRVEDVSVPMAVELLAIILGISSRRL